MARALKVFRTSAGFHDAYVAAPNQKAALEAWGADSNLFATGLAEIVTDPKLIEAPLAKPGHVIKVTKGTVAQHLASMPTSRKSQPGQADAKAARSKMPKSRPQPSRAKLDAVERAIQRLDKRREAALISIRKREDALRSEREVLDKKHAAAKAKLALRLSEIQADFDRAMEHWRG